MRGRLVVYVLTLASIIVFLRQRIPVDLRTYDTAPYSTVHCPSTVRCLIWRSFGQDAKGINSNDLNLQHGLTMIVPA